MDDYRNTFNGAGVLGALVPGGSLSGAGESAYDYDFFGVTLELGKTYRFTLTGNGAGALPDYNLTLHDNSGGYLGGSSNFGVGTVADVLYTATRAGTYYLEAGGAYSTSTGSYVVAATAGFFDDYGDLFNSTLEPLGAIAPGGTKTGSIETESDKDLFAVTLAAGTTYTVTLKGNGAGSLTDFGLELQDASGGYLSGVSAFTDEGASVTYTPKTSGTFYLEASGAYSSTKGAYTLAIPGGFGDDFRDIYNDGNEPLGTIALGGTKTGTVEIEGDKDIFAVSLSAGTTYTFTLKGNGAKPLADFGLELQDAAGGYLSSVSAFTAEGASLTYTPKTGGTFHLKASGAYSTTKGGYTLSVPGSLVDDYRDTHNDTSETLGSVAVGGTSGGRIELAGDDDVFAVTLKKGFTYFFDVLGKASGNGTLLDTSVSVLDGSGSQQISDSDPSGDSRAVFTAKSDGIHYLSAGGAYSTTTGTYKVAVSYGSRDDFRDTYNGAAEPLGTLSGEGTRTGSIDAAGDRDVFGVRLEKGGNYTFGLEGKANGGKALADSYLRLLDASGKAIAFNDDFNGDNSLISYTAGKSGVYYLEASSRSTGGTGNYSVWGYSGYDDVRDSTKGSSEASAGVKVGGSRAGTIEAGGDRDVFSVSLVKGRSYTFDLGGNGVGGKALVDGWLSLLDASGRTLFSNDDFNGDNARIVFSVSKTTTYYLEARSATSGGYGAYALSARLGFDDARDSIKQSSEALLRLGVNKSCGGTLETRADKDIFAMTLSAGKSYTFDLTGTKLAASALADGYLRLLDASGKALRVNDDFNGDDARIVFTAGKSGTYYLEASSAHGASSGGYKLFARSGFDDLADSITDPTAPLGRLAVGGRASGTIEVDRDSDVFRFSLKAGHTYSLGVDGGKAPGQLGHSEMQLFDKAGTLLAVNDDEAGTVDPELTFTAETSGTYYLDVTAIKHATGTYSVGLFDLG